MPTSHLLTAAPRSQDEGEQMPMYFMFLTLMSLYVFVREQVDVAVIEVGIGGAYDCTNVIRYGRVIREQRPVF